MFAVGAGLRVAAALQTDTVEKLRDSGRADYFAFSLSLKEVGVLGWSGTPSAFRGPAYPSFLACVESFEPETRPASPLIEAGLGSLEIPLAGWLAWELAGPWAAVAAAALTALHPALSWPVPACRVEPLYGLLVLLAAVCLLAWVRKPSWRRAAAAGFLISVGLLCRSGLVLFPVFLAAGLALRGVAGVPWKRSLWIIVGASYLFLLPWAVRNSHRFGRFIPLEDHAADRNFIAAVDGVVMNLPGPSPDGGPEIPFDELGSRRWGAVKKIAGHPLPYLASCLRRLARIVSWHGGLLFLACLGFLRRRSDPAAFVLGFLAAYYILMHSLLSLEARYIEPVLPVLAILGGAGASDWLSQSGHGGNASTPAAPPAWGQRLAMAAALAVALPLYILVVSFLARERI